MRWGKGFFENYYSKVPKFPLSSRPAGFLLAILFIVIPKITLFFA